MYIMKCMLKTNTKKTRKYKKKNDSTSCRTSIVIVRYVLDVMKKALTGPPTAVVWKTVANNEMNNNNNINNNNNNNNN